MINLIIALTAVNKRACKRVYRLYNINRPTLELLSCIQYLLAFRDTDAVGASLIIRGYGDNTRYQKKTERRLQLLLKDDFIKAHPHARGVSYSITPKGNNCLKYYTRSFNAVLFEGERHFKKRVKYGYLDYGLALPFQRKDAAKVPTSIINAKGN